MNYSEIAEISTQELVEIMKETQMKLTKLKLNHNVANIENPMLIRSVRKDIARIKTELTKRRKEA